MTEAHSEQVESDFQHTMPGAWEIFSVTLLPALLSAIVLIAAAWLPRARASAGPLAIGVAFITGYFSLEKPGFPPQDNFNWLVFLAMLITALATAVALLNAPTWTHWLLSLLLSVALVTRLLWPLLFPTDVASHIRAWTAPAILLTFLSCLSIDTLARQTQSASIPWIMTACAGFSTLALGMSDSQKFGLMSAALTFACLPLIFLASRWQRWNLFRSTPWLFTLLWLGLLINGHFWSNLRLPDALGLIIAPHATWLTEIPPLQRRLKPWQANLLRVALVLIILLAIVTPIAIRFHHDTQVFREDY